MLEVAFVGFVILFRSNCLIFSKQKGSNSSARSYLRHLKVSELVGWSVYFFWMQVIKIQEICSRIHLHMNIIVITVEIFNIQQF